MPSNIQIYNMDCLEAMKEMPDKAFDLAIVDPPYGLGHTNHIGGNNLAEINPDNMSWNLECPAEEYFIDVFRLSRNQIIWGVNYYPYPLFKGGRIVWDKDNSGNFSACELAYCSFHPSIKKFRYRWNGMLQEHGGRNKEHRIHPTQKPVALYKWLLKNYAKQGDKILDTHLGSGSIAIACYDMGHDLVGYEIDKDYFEAAQNRIENHKKQMTLF